jgi:hypothetical protein
MPNVFGMSLLGGGTDENCMDTRNRSRRFRLWFALIGVSLSSMFVGSS